MGIVNVQVTNKRGHTVGLRLDEDSDALARIRKRVKADELDDLKVSKASGGGGGRRRSKSSAVDVDESAGGGGDSAATEG